MMYEDIVRLMQKAGLKVTDTTHPDAVERFVASVAEWEREACAKLCEELRDSFLSPQYATGQPMSSIGERFAAGRCAAAIRARNEQEQPR